jgi:hypothetical protein
MRCTREAPIPLHWPRNLPPVTGRRPPKEGGRLESFRLVGQKAGDGFKMTIRTSTGTSRATCRFRLREYADAVIVTVLHRVEGSLR